jgi:hypothetical protein
MTVAAELIHGQRQPAISCVKKNGKQTIYIYICENGEVLMQQYLTVGVRGVAVQLRLEFLFEEDYCGNRKSMPRFREKKPE